MIFIIWNYIIVFIFVKKCMLSKSSKYAIRAVLFLSSKASFENKMGSKYIAEQLKIPAPFLAKTLQELSKKGIISSLKGPNGGFYLNKKNNTKNLFDIIACIDHLEKFENCFLGQLECNDQNPCVIHHIYAPFKNKLIKKMKNKTILDMANEHTKNNNAFNNL